MLLVKGGTIVNADRMFRADVLVADEKIVQVRRRRVDRPRLTHCPPLDCRVHRASQGVPRH
jgi:dihydroorotase-like cyclic amidohydrolase